MVTSSTAFKTRDVELQPTNFDILYEQGPCLAVLKPGGLLTQAPPAIDSLELRVKQFIKLRDDKPGRVYLGVPHRLDRPVSGVLVLAKHVRAARRLCDQFQDRSVRKTYWAYVAGTMESDTGTWIDYVRKVPDEPRAEVAAADHPDARQAVLHYRVLRRDECGTWLEIELETGRMHQIRLQAGSRGFPIFGDTQYGSSERFGPETQDDRARWIALHARSLEFLHPMTREPVSITAPLPVWWDAFGLPPS